MRLWPEHLQQMECQIWWSGCFCIEAAQGARGCEPQTETDVCRFEPGTSGAQGYC